MGRVVVAPLLGAAVVLFDVACAKLPAEGQQFLSLPGTSAERFTTCVRVASVSTPLVRRGADAATAERRAIEDLAAAAVEAGGNFVRVECATWTPSSSRQRVALTGSAYRCAQVHSSPDGAGQEANHRESAVSFQCAPSNDGLLTCTRNVEPDTSVNDGYSNELKNTTRAVAPPPDLPPVDCGVGIHDGFYTRVALGLQATSHIAPSGTILVGYDGWASEQGSIGVFVALTAAPSTAVHVVGPGVSVDAAPLAVSLEASFTYH